MARRRLDSLRGRRHCRSRRSSSPELPTGPTENDFPWTSADWASGAPVTRAYIPRSTLSPVESGSRLLMRIIHVASRSTSVNDGTTRVSSSRQPGSMISSQGSSARPLARSRAS